ncbi:hypothetical protein QBE52_07065 [Clostridiaceae bacterium 35-E11]
MKKKFIDVPFLPKEDVATVIVDGRTSSTIMNNLYNKAIHIIKTPLCNDIYDAIKGHPDLLLHPVTSQDIVVAPNVYKQLKDPLEALGCNIIKGRTVLKRNYPDNIAYNIARVSNFAIHNFNYTDRCTLELLERKEIKRIHVKQGYSKCSICIVNDHAIITSDRGIAKAVEKHGIEVLTIAPGYIDLPGLDYGFIGGTSGLIGKNKLAFSGYLEHHSDYAEILYFLKRHNVAEIFLSKDKPMDIGSIIPLLEMVY